MLVIEKFSQSNKLFDGHYKLLRPLSTDGGTADVWLAVDVNMRDVSFESEEGETDEKDDDEESGMLVAVKIYRPKNALDVDGEQRFRNEFKIVYECRHENLLQPTSFSIYEGIPYLVLPYCKSGSSEQLIGKQLTNDEIWRFILDVSSGLNKLHTNEPPIIHQDIKPANILIDNSKDYVITDFGISSKRGGVHGFYYDEENSGTMAYMAPERFQDDVEPMAQSDIWAFGATLYEILTGEVPFGEEGGKNQVETPKQMPSVGHVSPDIQRLIHDCLSLEPNDRPTAKEIKEAAIAKQYPLKPRNKTIWFVAISALIAVLAGVVIFLLPVKNEEPEVQEIPIEEIYKTALADIDSDDAKTVRKGLAVMDSLSNIRYVPAIFQMAYTYGWYVEDKSLKRKKMLGIEVFNNEKDNLYCLPKIDRYNNEALALLSRILELNDSTYSSINAQAAYRLAYYYVNPNHIIKPNMAKGKEYLELSRKWALLSNDTTLLGKINRSLQTFN